MPQAIKDAGAARRLPHHLRQRAAEGRRGARRQRDGRAHEGRRLHRDRQDQHARVRARLAHLQQPVRRHAATPGIERSAPAAPAAAPRCAWRSACCRWPTAPTSWAACATPPAGTTCSACGPSQGRVPAVAASRRVGRASSAPKARWRAACATSRSCCRSRPATIRARRCRSRRAAQTSCRGARRRRARPAHRLARRPGRPPARIEPGIARRPAKRRCARMAGDGAVVEPVTLDRHRPRPRCGRPGSCGAARWWRRASAPLLTLPGARAQHQARGAVGVRPGAGAEPRATSCAPARCARDLYAAPARAVRALRRAGAAGGTGVAVRREPSIGRSRSPAARWTPTTAGWRPRSTPPSPACRRSACRPASTPTAAGRWGCS